MHWHPRPAMKVRGRPKWPAALAVCQPWSAAGPTPRVHDLPDVTSPVTIGRRSYSVGFVYPQLFHVLGRNLVDTRSCPRFNARMMGHVGESTAWPG